MITFEKIKKIGNYFREAVKELSKEEKFTINYGKMMKFVKNFDEYCYVTHACSYEIFKKYAVHLWEISRVRLTSSPQ